MGIHYDYKSKRGERAMLKEAKRKVMAKKWVIDFYSVSGAPLASYKSLKQD